METKTLSEYSKPHLTLATLESHREEVLAVVAENEGATAFQIFHMLQKRFVLTTGTAYRIYKRLAKDNHLIYTPYHPLQGGLKKIFSLPSRYVSINIKRAKTLPTLLAGKPWAKNLKIVEAGPDMLRWDYTAKRADGLAAPTLYIKSDGVYENPHTNRHLDLPQRVGIAETAVKILRSNQCIN